MYSLAGWKNLFLIALLASILLWSPIVFMGVTELSTNIAQLLLELW